jgi:STELLO glycosyltransferases
MNSLVITTINDNEILLYYDKECKRRSINLIVIGDRKTPKLDFKSFFSLEDQYNSDIKICKKIPENHYARKNIGYILAKESNVIIETDDDNLPYDNFWTIPNKKIYCPEITSENKWVNVYKFFSDKIIWPRGLSLSNLNNNKIDVRFTCNNCPIQQRLANLNPDVDAIYRFIYSEDIHFNNGDYALNKNTISPFNSQNTVWFSEVYPLMYLPTYCSFRMTDIYRSFIAQRILWTIDSKLLFSSPSAYQIRNEHNIMSDFRQEVEGYLSVDKIVDVLFNTNLKEGLENMSENLYQCYDNLVSNGFFQSEEMSILETWIDEIER